MKRFLFVISAVIFVLATGAMANAQNIKGKENIIDNTLFYREMKSGNEIHFYFSILKSSDKLSFWKMMEIMKAMDDLLALEHYSKISISETPKKIVFLDLIQTQKGLRVIIEAEGHYFWQVFDFKNDPQGLAKYIMLLMFSKKI